MVGNIRLLFSDIRKHSKQSLKNKINEYYDDVTEFVKEKGVRTTKAGYEV